MKKEEIYDAITNGNAYDLVACNYYLLGHEEMKDILLEYIYAFEKITQYDNYKKEDIVNELKERWED